MEKIEDLINWVEVSRLLANNDTSVSRNRCPKKYQARVNELLSAVDSWTKTSTLIDEVVGEEE